MTSIKKLKEGCGKPLGKKEIGTSIGDIEQDFFCGRVLEIDDMKLIDYCPICKAKISEHESVMEDVEKVIDNCNCDRYYKIFVKELKSKLKETLTK